MERDEIVEFHRRHHRLRGAKLVIAGDFDGDRVAERIAERVPPDADGTPIAPPTIVAPVRNRVEVVIVDRPRAAQTELRVGHVGVPRVHPDRTGLGFLNSLLGGKFTSRINLNLRERHAVTYGAHSRLVDRRSAGPFVVSAAVANSGVGLAARETLHELARLQDEPVDPAEIEETRNFLLGVFPYGLQSIEGLAAKLRDIALYGLPLDHPLRVLETYRRIDSRELQRLARTHLSPATCLVVAAGPAAEIAPQLEELGPSSTVEPAR
jgi:zinc protease